MAAEGNPGAAREIVVPGQPLAKGMDMLPGDGTYRAGEEIRASVLGILEEKGRLVKVIPLGGKYLPREGDVVIGVVDGVRFSNWSVEVNSPYGAVLPISEASESYIDTRKNDMTDFFAIGDTILARVALVDSQMNTNVSMRGPGLQKLQGGHVFEMASAKVPRVIGRGGSMIRTLKEATGCNILVGQNGRVWVKGQNRKSEALAIRTIRQIEAEAHTSGLTNRIRSSLGLPPEEERPQQQQQGPQQNNDGGDFEYG